MTDIAETLSNPTGGIRQLTIYQGLLTVSLSLTSKNIANWPGASFYTDAYQISGRGLSRNAIGNLLAVSTIEALPSTRLHDLWLQQELLDGQASFRVGQIALDDEFYISQYSAIFSQLDVWLSGSSVDRLAERGTLLSVRGTGRASPGCADNGS